MSWQASQASELGTSDGPAFLRSRPVSAAMSSGVSRRLDPVHNATS